MRSRFQSMFSVVLLRDRALCIMPYENLSNIDDYQLISFIENSPELWQLGHPNYCNTSLKTQIWRDIANLMGFEVSVCRNRWVNIRDNYRRSLKKSMIENGHKTYKFFEELSFLKSSILEGTKGNFCSSQNTDFTETSASDAKIENQAHNLESNLASLKASKPSTSTKRMQSPLISQIATSREKRLRRTEAPVENNIQETAQHDAVDAFLAGVAPTLKSLTPYYLNLAKSKIFMTIQKYEMQMIMEAQNREVEYEDPYEIYTQNDDSDTDLPEKNLDTKENILSSPNI